jgi:hypothetical protein
MNPCARALQSSVAIVALFASAVAQSWIQSGPSAAPSPRNSAGFAHDDATGASLLFGGYDGSGVPLGDAWLWNGGNWQAVAAPGPSARWGHGLVFDRARRRFVLFGGFRPGAMLQDVWEFDGALWTQASPPSSPPPRAYHAMAYDAANRRTLVFGGVTHNNALLGDCWAWNGGIWAAIATPAALTPRRSPAMAYDARRRLVSLFGGEHNGVVLAETWSLDGATWAAVTNSPPPPARQAAAMAYDGVREVVVMTGGADAGFANNLGDCWEFDGRHWAQAPAGPTPRHGAAMAFDTWRGGIVLFGGGTAGGYVGDTWRRAAAAPATTAWTVASATGPTGALYPAMAYDAARGQTVVHGGFRLTGPGWMGGGSPSVSTSTLTRLWNGTTWTTTTSLPARHSHAMVYDAARARIVLFGGASSSYPLPTTAHGDTYEWNGATWTPAVVGQPGPSPRLGHGMAYDSVRNRVVLFGGTDATQSASATTADTWEYDGVAWLQRNPLQSPSPRYAHAMGFDPLRGRTVLHGGYAPGLDDATWEYDGTTWTQAAGPSPSPRANHAMAFDAARGALVLTGGSEGDFWQRQGTAWTRANASKPSPRHLGRLAYDSARQRMVLFGGVNLKTPGVSDTSQTFDAYPRDTWELTPATLAGPYATAFAGEFGYGCGPDPFRLRQFPGVAPTLGSHLHVVVERAYRYAPIESTLIAFGASATDLPGGTALPIALPGVLAPGCMVWQSADLAMGIGLATAQPGAFFLRIPIPNSPAYLGLRLHAQAWGLSLVASGLFASNGLTWQIGNV